MKEHFRNDNQRSTAGDDRALSGLSSFDAQLGPSHMGYISSLDGLRALAVLAVILYHAHFSWIRGGFIGVEVFFVVSGFLITSLLFEESEDTGAISLQQFWLRRARRLLPALFTMLVAVSAWALLFSKYKVGQLRHDFLSAVFYISNWWQIFSSNVPYFAPKDPPLLRHLWSLAVKNNGICCGQLHLSRYSSGVKTVRRLLRCYSLLRRSSWSLLPLHIPRATVTASTFCISPPLRDQLACCLARRVLACGDHGALRVLRREGAPRQPIFQSAPSTLRHWSAVRC